MSTGKLSDYQKALHIASVMPRFYLGQEAQTKDGKDIIVDLKIQWNGLYIEPDTSEAVVWYSTEGSNWVSFTYKLTELSVS